MTTTNNTPKKRGLAALSPEKRKEISAKGGRAAAQSGKAHRFTSEEARDAGRKGGKAPKTRGRYRDLLSD